MLMAYTLSKWDLSEIAPKSGAEQEIGRICVSLEKERKNLKDLSPKRFLGLMRNLEELKKKASKLGGHAHLRFMENSADQKASADLSRLQMFLTQIDNRLLFISLWFKDLSDDAAEKYLAVSGKYRYYLEQVRQTRQYTLSEKEEFISNVLHASGISSLTTVFNMLTSQFMYDIDGKALTHNEVMERFRDNDPKVRETAYLTLLTKYEGYKDVIGEIYRATCNTWREENIGIRKYKSPISVRNVMNDIPDEAIETLLSVCQKNEHLFHRFFALKQKELGLKRMRRFDIYAPLKEERKGILYDEAVRLVLETFTEFSPDFGRLAKEVIEKKHVHSIITKNKHTGAFCAGLATDVLPYVLLNYVGSLRDVETLSHELGHAVHYGLAAQETEFTQDACLPLAETASIFGEMLLTEQMKKRYPKEARIMIFSKIDEMYATIIRQAGFVIFEKKAHDMIAKGSTIDEMSDEYLRLLKKQLGPGIEIDPLFRYEWSYVPHIFHTPFYCYAYAFGNLFVLALYARYKKEGQPFAQKIITLLSRGGSASPADIAKEVGIDISKASFWQDGFKIIEGMIDELGKK
jgi:oligoendopeptidase F